MSPDLLQPLQILTKLALHSVGQYLRVLAIHNVALSVEEPAWDFVLSGILDDCNDPLELFRCDLTGTATCQNLFSINLTASVPFVQVDISLLADQIGVATSDTLDLGQRIHDLLFAIDVGVEKTEDELEVRLLSTDESCRY